MIRAARDQVLPDSKGEPGARHEGHESGPPTVAPPDAEESQGADDEKGNGRRRDKRWKASAEMIEEVERHPHLEDHAQPEETPHACPLPDPLLL